MTTRPAPPLTSGPRVEIEDPVARAIGLLQFHLLRYAWEQSHRSAEVEFREGRLYVRLRPVAAMRAIGIDRHQERRTRESLLSLKLLVEADWRKGWYAVDPAPLADLCPLYKAASALGPPVETPPGKSSEPAHFAGQKSSETAQSAGVKSSETAHFAGSLNKDFALLALLALHAGAREEEGEEGANGAAARGRAVEMLDHLDVIGAATDNVIAAAEGDVEYVVAMVNKAMFLKRAGLLRTTPGGFVITAAGACPRYAVSDVAKWEAANQGRATGPVNARADFDRQVALLVKELRPS